MSRAAHKLTVHFGERSRVDGRFLSDVLLDECARLDIASSVLMRAASGFGLRHHLRTDALLSLSEDPTVLAVAVDDPERIDRLRAVAERHCARGLLVVESARVLGVDDDLADVTEARLVCHLGRGVRIGGEPAHLTVCALLQRHGVDGATVLTGVDGTAEGVRRRARFWSGNAQVPARVVAVGSGASLSSALPELRAVLAGAGPILLAGEQVSVCRRDGRPLAEPPHATGPDAWQRLTVITSESRLHDGEPVHRALLRRLRAGRARGVTVQRGIWGYHGAHAPHGDRLLQWGRRVPVVTTTVDTADRIVEAFAVAEDLTAEHGLVVVESVPSAMHLG